VVRVEAAGVELRDLGIRNSGDSYLTEDAAIRLQQAAGVRIDNVRIEDALFGVFAVQADDCAIERSFIAGKDLPPDRRGDGIRLWASHGCRLIGNRVEKSRDVVIWYSSDTLVEDNVVRLGRYGLHYMYSDRNRFRRNRFEDNQVGATIMYSRGVELSQNAFSFARGATGYGLLVKDADDIFIEENRFVDNSTGLFFDGAPQSKGGRVRVHKNLIARNDVGLALEPRNGGIEVWENSFIGNGAQVQVTGSGGQRYAFAAGGRGNYWSDAIVYDPRGSGISSLPHRIETTYEALEARAPLLAFFSGTPAAEAIDAAARLFPVVAPRERAVDPHPLAKPLLTPWLVGDATAPRAGLAAAGAGLLAAVAGALVAFRRMA
jgi:nitrous oxidase accessory protein